MLIAMGSYYELVIGHFLADTAKASLPEYAMMPFRPDDRVKAKSEEERPHIYKSDVTTVGRRLDLLGFSVPAARRAFEKGVGRLDDEQRESWPDELLAPDGFDAWLDAMKIAVDAARRLEHVEASETTDERLRFMLRWEEHMFGFPFGAPEVVLRAILTASSPDDEVTLDFNDLVTGGYLVVDEHFWSLEGQQPLIIVTEGKSDSRLLRLSLKILHPEFERFFTFIDFETANAKGGTDELVQFVRMFIGCGIRNRIVVLFDNDAAGHEALQRLLEAKLPSHVFAMTLPTLESAKSHPTLGPDGPSTADINGRACSLELYLGRDVLLDREGQMLPVRWAGFNDKLQRYQGQILNKSAVQKRFDEKLTAAARDLSSKATRDFDGIRAIFDAVFAAVGAR